MYVCGSTVETRTARFVTASCRRSSVVAASGASQGVRAAKTSYGQPREKKREAAAVEALQRRGREIAGYPDAYKDAGSGLCKRVWLMAIADGVEREQNELVRVQQRVHRHDTAHGRCRWDIGLVRNHGRQHTRTPAAAGKHPVLASG